MKTFKTFGELESAPKEIQNVMEQFLQGICDTTNDYRVIANKKDTTISELTGGAWYVAETIEDVNFIHANQNYAWGKIPFEIEEQVDGGWWHMWTATNNSGGPSWFVPNGLYEDYKKINPVGN